jgi:dipeptidyl aminopeptidase/acylaminoacyl peptidase
MKKSLQLIIIAGVIISILPATRAQPRTPGRAYKMNIVPNWFADNTHFWYRNNLHDGIREFVLVDAVKGIRKPAFDHKLLSDALKASGLKDISANRLPLENPDFRLAENALFFRANSQQWRCNLTSYKLQKLDQHQSSREKDASSLPTTNIPTISYQTGPETAIIFDNQTSNEVELFWIDTSGRRQSYGKLPPGKERNQHTFTGHIWEALDSKGNIIAAFQATENPNRAIITGNSKVTRRNRRQSPRRRQPENTFTNKKWKSFVKDGNVFIRSKADNTQVQLSKDGSPERSYGMLQWSPDSKTLIAFRIEPGDRKEVHLVESSPDQGGRAKLSSRPYPLPGDKFTSYELNLFNIATKKQIKPKVEPIDFGRPHLRWNSDHRHFTYEKTDRGHQRFRVIEVDTHTGSVRNIIDEKSETFIWRAHTQNLRLSHVNWIANTNEIIYVSERDGWRHLYLIDSETGKIKTQITKGNFVVRAIDKIDEDKRQIWFCASGKNPDQDPYFIHYYRVNFDGSGLVALTTGNGQHSIRYSPDARYIIDTFSRIDKASVHELRRVTDGRLMCKLEEADISKLEDQGFEPPEVFVAKGRDNKTDIWGIICRPADFDPSHKYPIIEDIYAGPHGSFVPKNFSTSPRYQSLTDLGFIVVKIDGMGTANRSKAFHDICWKNLKDAGFPDRIRWIKAAAKKFPYMDTSRVGIYGNSAGGQNAAGAVLFHHDFYKAAVASCGCHDNRMDKASWNEQWMGYPVGPHYAECSNIDNAHRLQGNLMLIVGEMDTNVPPESTMRMVDALIKADKDFDLIVIPGAGHGGGGAYGRRRMQDFFVRHLQKN